MMTVVVQQSVLKADGEEVWSAREATVWVLGDLGLRWISCLLLISEADIESSCLYSTAQVIPLSGRET